MIRINLLACEKKAARKSAWLQTCQAPTVVCGFILVAAVLFVGWRFWAIGRDRTRLDRDSSIAQQESQRLHAEIQQVEQFEQRRAQLLQRLAFIEELRRNQTGPVRMLDEISRALPDMLWLTGLRHGVDAHDVTIEGLSTSLTGLSDFVESLEGSGYLERAVEILSTQVQAIAGPPGELIRFQIRAIFEPPSGDVPATAQHAVPSAVANRLN